MAHRDSHVSRSHECEVVGGTQLRSGVLQDGILEEEVPEEIGLYIGRRRLKNRERDAIVEYSDVSVENSYVSALTLSSLGSFATHDSIATEFFESFASFRDPDQEQNPAISLTARQEQYMGFGTAVVVTEPRQPQRQSSLDDGSSHSDGTVMEPNSQGREPAPSADMATELSQPQQQTPIDGGSSHSGKSLNLSRRARFKEFYGCGDRKQSRRDIWLSHKNGLSAITEDCETPMNVLDQSLCVNFDNSVCASSVTMSETRRNNLNNLNRSPRSDDAFCNASIDKPSETISLSGSSCDDVSSITLSECLRITRTLAHRQPPSNCKLPYWRESESSGTSDTAKAPRQPHRQISWKRIQARESTKSMAAPCQPRRQISHPKMCPMA